MNGEELDPALVAAVTAALKAQNKEKEKSNALNSVAVQNAKENLDLQQSLFETAKNTAGTTENTLKLKKQELEAAEKYYNKVIKAQKDLNKLADNAPDVLKGIFSGDASGQASKGLNSLALGNVVVICSCFINALDKFIRRAFLCEEVLFNLR